MTTLYVYTQRDKHDEIIFRQRSFYREMHKYLSTIMEGDIDSLMSTIPSNKTLTHQCAKYQHEFYKIDAWQEIGIVLYQIIIMNSDTELLLLDEVATRDEIHKQFLPTLGSSFENFIKLLDGLPDDKALSLDVGNRKMEITYYEMEKLH